MPLAPRFFKSHTIYPSRSPSVVTVELYLDYCCPFSSKLFLNWYDSVIPEIQKQLGADSFQFQLIQVPQPWHASSCYMHEAGLAVARLSPDNMIEFSRRLFEGQTKWFDEPTFEKSRSQIGQGLAQFAEKHAGVPASQIYDLIEIKNSGGEAKNGGNAVTNDLKYFVRYQRQNGVHVTPSVAVNGVILPAIESSTSAEDVVKILRMQM
ncbi:LAMI_0F08900g1_1 [Lachancea mirantina]|uniref:LAMI_0F08900g1_1 n=1 Tax=Lachancea mirantina TaxID=1230905 RepID=A0A1G4K0Q4_9SACH|nr:LAMI_0F08900g1_1 [Lachancea mirantina]